MNFEIPLIGLALYLLFWDKLPNWGTWFNWILRHMPKFIQSIYDAWKCAYCSGFWIGLALHAALGIWFIPELQTLPSYWEPIDPVIGWFLDALAVATAVLTAKMLLDVIKAHR